MSTSKNALNTITTLAADLDGADLSYALRAIADKAGRDRVLDFANDIARENYWASVRGIAEEVEEEIRTWISLGDDPEDVRERAMQHVTESVDGSYHVIYTHANLDCLRWTDNLDAYEEVTGEEGASLAIRAYFAMEADAHSLVNIDDVIESMDDPTVD